MKIIDKIWLLAAMFTFSACGSDETIVGQEEPEKELKEYTVSLKLGGEITTSESPLARAETESTDLYGVQVYRMNNGGTYNHAFGIFDCVESMNVNLLEGSTYRFIVTLIKDGKNRVYKGVSGYDYGYPFQVSYYIGSINSFIYDSGFYDLEYLGVGKISISETSEIKYPEVDWYYGEVENYAPSVNGTVEIDLKHTVFGLRCEVSGITDGTVSVTIKNDTRTFFTKSDITTDYTSEEKIIAFYDVKNAWQYADNYTENLTVSLSWTRGIGVVQDLGTKTIQVERNVMNVVRIQLGSNDGSATFGITTEDDSSMTEENVDVPLE